ncbi:MAG: hypothetical protein Q8L21_01340 [Candidatus Komeilibacteria bacterium]|nr:hypothetical protein [Candidatus Komeilibacteria bacterium]
MNRIIAVFVLAMISLAGCAANNPTIRHGLGARAEQADLCSLTVVNETPYTFKFRVGHLWWEVQAGLLPHTSTGNKPMMIEQDEEHVLTRIISVEGRVTEDRYYFYVPKGTKKHTITFGGLQTGIIVNRTAEELRVVPPGAATFNRAAASLNGTRLKLDSLRVEHTLPDSVSSWGFMLHPGEAKKFSVLPGKASFIFYYGAELKERYVEIKFVINDVHADVAYNGGYLDWVGYVDPVDLWKSRSARPW